MDNVNLKRINTKSENGFTFTDLAIAIFVIMLFAGTIGTILYQITEVKLSTQLSAEATVCAIQILEDIEDVYKRQIKGDFVTLEKNTSIFSAVMRNIIV